LGPAEGSEGAADLLFDFDHANVLLGLIVGEGHGGIAQEAQNGLPMQAQTVQQIDHFGFGLSGSSFADGLRGRKEILVGVAAAQMAVAESMPTAFQGKIAARSSRVWGAFSSTPILLSPLHFQGHSSFFEHFFLPDT
jgi:hypothetical protein